VPTDSISALESFRSHGYAVIGGLIATDRTVRLRDHLAARAAAGTLRMRGDDQVPGTPHVYGDPEIDALMQDIKPAVEIHSGLSLHPTYSFARIYKNGDVLPPHRDREACEISISLNLGQEPSAPWPLNIGEQHAPFAAMLGPGDGVLYKGMELTHWRNAYQGSRMFQVFLHYVDANGPHAGEKFDSRASLSNPFQPEMTGLLGRFMVPRLTDLT